MKQCSCAPIAVSQRPKLNNSRLEQSKATATIIDRKSNRIYLAQTP